MEKILIICETGISAALFVSKFLEELRNRELNIDVDYAQTYKLEKNHFNMNDYDALVLTPQISKNPNIKKVLRNAKEDTQIIYMTEKEYKYQNITDVFKRINITSNN